MDTTLRKVLLTATIAALLFTSADVRGDDTDVYLNPGDGLPPGSEPMVMFSLDYRPNLGATACNGSECDTLIAEGYLPATGPYTFFDVLQASLAKVFEPLEGVRVGLMLNHDYINNCTGYGRTDCSNGGYIAMGFETFEKGDTNGAKARFLGILKAMPTPQGGQSHSYQGKELFFEFFRYLTGQGVYNAHNGYTDYFTSDTDNVDVDHPAIAWDKSIETGPMTEPLYTSPIDAAGACSKIYSVNFMFQVTNQEDDSDAAIEASVASGGFGSPQATFPDVLKYLNDADLADGTYGTVPDLEDKQNLTSFFLVDPRFINTTTTGYARAGGTGVPLPLSEDPDTLVATLKEIFRQILSVSTTFVAASVPVNVFNRAEITDNVYIALFQVNGEGKPTWVGNVKKLSLTSANDSNGTSQLVDRLGQPAVAADGRIRFDALTYWTDPASLPPADTELGEVDGRDGRAVARGGAGQRIPGYLSGSPREVNALGGRRMFYDLTPTSLAPFNADTKTIQELQPDFDVATTREAGELIAFTRGLDIDDIDGDKIRDEARDWIFGDALHSRPLPINYGNANGHSDPTNPAIYIAVATNDGMLRMIRNTSTGGVELGREAWAFVPRRTLDKQKTLRANGVGMQHPYTIDGAPVAYIQDRNQDGTISAADGDRVYLFIGMRRGDRSYYALDVTNPETPQLLWRIDNSGDFAELGYTFSTPRVGLVSTPTGPTPAVMFAGGYDMNKDTRGTLGTDDTMGNAIYVVNAETGALIWKARGGGAGIGTTVFEHPRMVDSIPSTMAAGDTDGDGLTDRLYVGDTGGKVWRIDMQGPETSKWKATVLADLGRHGTVSPSIATDRRFFHRPDIVQSQDANGLFDAVVIGSGNRPDPLDYGGLSDNFVYMIKDRLVIPGSGADTTLTHADFGDVTDNCLQAGSCSIDLEKGWRLGLTEIGEKALSTPLTINGKVFFTTYLPKAGTGATACSPSEGGGRLYAVGLQNAFAVLNYNTADDTTDNPDGADTLSDRSVELQSLGIPAEVVSIPPNKILRPDLQIDNVDVATRWRTFWYLQEDEDL